MQFSVIIPTLNRCDLLANALASVRTQSFPDKEYEIIVVDNGATDGTRESIEWLNQDGDKEIHYVYEARPGLHWARHAGAKVARFEILVYTDDDAIAHPDWLKNLEKAYTELEADCVGGKIIIKWDQAPPAWVVPYEGVLGRLDYGPEMRLLHPCQNINGGNFSIRKDRLYQVGGFNPDQIGDYLIGDGETGLCRKVHQAHLRVVWAPDAIVWHCQTVGKNGLLQDLKRRFRNNGRCDAYAYFKHGECSRNSLLYYAARTIYSALKQELYAIWHVYFRVAAYRTNVLHAKQSWSRAKYLMRLIYDRELRAFASRKDWIHEAFEDGSNANA